MRTEKSALLINPPVYDFAAFDLWSKPIGLLSFSRILKHLGFQVRLIDVMDRQSPLLGKGFQTQDKRFGTGKFEKIEVEKPEPLKRFRRNFHRFGVSTERIRDELGKSEKPNLVMITSGMTYWYLGIQEIVQLVRQIWPDCKIHLGGIYANLCPDHARTTLDVDHVSSGETPEKYISRILAELKEDGPLPDLSNWPYPDYSLYPKLTYASIATTLGCPYKCSYCASSTLFPKYRQRKKEDVIEECLELIQSQRVKDFAFYDDALLIDAKNHILPILDAVTKEAPETRFHTPNGLHSRLITQEVADWMYKKNFKTLRLSFETSDPELQKSTGGKVTNKEFLRTVKNLQRAGYSQEELRTYILVGLPGQTKEQMWDCIDFVFDAGANPVLTEYSMIPGSADWSQWKQDLGLEKLDPLLHNNSIFAAQMGWLPLEELEEMKDLVRERREKIRKSSETGTSYSSSVP